VGCDVAREREREDLSLRSFSLLWFRSGAAAANVIGMSEVKSAERGQSKYVVAADMSCVIAWAERDDVYER